MSSACRQAAAAVVSFPTEPSFAYPLKLLTLCSHMHVELEG